MTEEEINDYYPCVDDKMAIGRGLSGLTAIKFYIKNSRYKFDDQIRRINLYYYNKNMKLTHGFRFNVNMGSL